MLCCSGMTWSGSTRSVFTRRNCFLCRAFCLVYYSSYSSYSSYIAEIAHIADIADIELDSLNDRRKQDWSPGMVYRKPPFRSPAKADLARGNKFAKWNSCVFAIVRGTTFLFRMSEEMKLPLWAGSKLTQFYHVLTGLVWPLGGSEIILAPGIPMWREAASETSKPLGILTQKHGRRDHHPMVRWVFQENHRKP